MKADPNLPRVFESGELTDLIGVKPIYLNKFVERGLYGIRPSVRTGKARERRRLFSEDDVLGVALVWWLFEGGLRAQAIQYVLNQIRGHLEASANEAARKLVGQQGQTLVVSRKPRLAKHRHAKFPPQRVQIVEASRVPQLVREGLAEGIQIIIPIGNLFANLERAVESGRRLG